VSHSRTLPLKFISCFIVFVFLIIGVSLDSFLIQGFNPSDDGVILAQAYRLIHGEVAHSDFISIRPFLSSVLHSIHFFSPLPLFYSAKLFVIIQFLVISILWSFLLTKQVEENFKITWTGSILFWLITLLTFILNINTLLLFPWTTIDGVFLGTIGVFLVYLGNAFDKLKIKPWALSIGLTFLSLASLTKQSFLFFSAVSFGIIIITLWATNKKKSVPFLLLAFSLPFGAYLIYLMIHQNAGLFIIQLTGRSELYETGLLPYWKNFKNSNFLVVYLITCFLLFDFKFGILAKIQSKTLEQRIILAFNSIFLLIATATSFSFFKASSDYSKTPYELFFILTFGLLFNSPFLTTKPNHYFLYILCLVLAWSSSISVGVNSPLFAMGLLFGCILVLFLNSTITKKSTNIFQSFKTTSILIILLIVGALLMVWRQADKNKNYRDKPNIDLTKNLGILFSTMEGIYTSENTFDYFSDFKYQYKKHVGPNDYIVTIPNSAFIYPAISQRNPFPIDWLQKPEYHGSEQQLSQSIQIAIKSKPIVFFIDKYDSKRIAFTKSKMNYNTSDYSYMPLILKNTIPLESDSKYFNIYRSN
jgi:hypothetical protein